MSMRKTDKNKQSTIEIIEVSDEASINKAERIAKEIWRQHYIPIIGKDQVKYMLEKFQSKQAIYEQIQNGFIYYLVKLDDDYLGYLSILLKEDTGELFLSKIYIRLEQRGKGYGKMTMDFIESLARRRNLNRITLTVNKHNADSIKAYQKMGFRIVDSIVQDIGGGFIMDDYGMEKLL